MHIILGANGHIGSVVAQTLIERGELVLAVLHSDASAADWKRRGAEVTVADVFDTAALSDVLRRGKRLFLLNPPAPPTTDTAQQERKSVASIVAALDRVQLEKVVAESTYGAQPGEQVGDLGVLYELEQKLASRPTPSCVIRGAYYMSNWDYVLESARNDGVVSTFYPPDFVLPMVAPHDIGKVAARMMMEPPTSTGLHHVEGPARYSSRDVAAAFGKALGRKVEPVETSPAKWEQAMEAQGFSKPAAKSFAAMTSASLKTKLPEEESVIRGTTSLQEYIDQLVAKGEGRGGM
jgi:uncharacterized protein YbjT (DUF2867 family)